MTSDSRATAGEIWQRPGLSGAIHQALTRLDSEGTMLSFDDLAPIDQLHSGGIDATRALARLLGPRPGSHILDVGGGLGGPARLLAAEFGCLVTVLDITEEYLRAGALLTAHLRLQERVRFDLGSALALPFPDEGFDVVWTQNSGMNIDDKATMYGEFHRVLRPGGRLATQEPVAGPIQPPHFPLMWARDVSANFLVTAEVMRECICNAGFRELHWEEPRFAPPSRPSAGGGALPIAIQQQIRGDDFAAIQAAGLRNDQEGRVGRIQAIFARP